MRSGLFLPGLSKRISVGAFTPADLANLHAWYDADDAATITDTAGDVTQWDDKSGNAHHLTSVTGTPSTGTRTQNGKNVIDFDGAVGEAIGRSAMTWPATFSIYAVAGIDASDSQFDSLWSVDAANDYQFESGNDIINTFQGLINASNIGFASLSADATQRHGPEIYGNKMNAADGAVEMIYARSVIASNALYNGSISASQFFRLMTNRVASQFLGGFIAEVVITSDFLGSSDETDLYDYFDSKWGV